MEFNNDDFVNYETFERLVIGAVMLEQMDESESETLLEMKDKNDLMDSFKALEHTLKRNALLKRLIKGAEMIESAKSEEEKIKYQRLYNAIEKKYSEVNQQCKIYGL